MYQSVLLCKGNELPNTHRLSHSVLEFDLDAKSSLLRPLSERPVIGSSLMSQLGNGTGAHQPFDHL
jgi:hypothetical protein